MRQVKQGAVLMNIPSAPLNSFMIHQRDYRISARKGTPGISDRNPMCRTHAGLQNNEILVCGTGTIWASLDSQQRPTGYPGVNIHCKTVGKMRGVDPKGKEPNYSSQILRFSWKFEGQCMLNSVRSKILPPKSKYREWRWYHLRGGCVCTCARWQEENTKNQRPELTAQYRWWALFTKGGSSPGEDSAPFIVTHYKPLWVCRLERGEKNKAIRYMRFEINSNITPSIPQAFAVGVNWPNQLSVCVKIKVTGPPAQQPGEDSPPAWRAAPEGRQCITVLFPLRKEGSSRWGDKKCHSRFTVKWLFESDLWQEDHGSHYNPTDYVVIF